MLIRLSILLHIMVVSNIATTPLRSGDFEGMRGRVADRSRLCCCPRFCPPCLLLSAASSLHPPPSPRPPSTEDRGPSPPPTGRGECVRATAASGERSGESSTRREGRRAKHSDDRAAAHSTAARHSNALRIGRGCAQSRAPRLVSVMAATLDSLLNFKAPAAATGAAAAPAAAASAAPAAASAGESAFLKQVFQHLVQTTKLAKQLPDADDHKFFATTSQAFKAKAQATQTQLLNLLGLVSDAVRHPHESAVAHNTKSAAAVAIVTAGALPPSRSYTGLADSLDQFHGVVDTTDSALEQVDLLLDASRGVKRGNTALAGALGDARGRTQFTSSHTMAKPQRAFAHLIDNSTRTWIPILPTKPNAQTPLLDYEALRAAREAKPAGKSNAVSSSLAAAMDEGADDKAQAMSSHIASLGLSSEKPVAASLYPHPYKYEIENLSFDANPDQLKSCKEQLYKPLDRVPCIWVDTPEALEEMATELDAASEIAIDLEHHSFRTYLGLTCLMQISTRRADWLVDTLALRTQLHRLNTSFTDPAVVKVLHGSDSDVIWLQRDFGLYIVNLFDTGQAARILEFQSFGLAYLLKFFCEVDTNKKYQLADWRIRPLSAEMLLYARMDTHYLLYIYDRLRNDLITRSTAAQNQLSPIRNCPYLLAQVLERSKQICLKTFEKEASGGGDPMEFAYKMGILLSNDTQSRMLVQLFHLRDEIARQEDESVFYICNNQNLAQIIQAQPADQHALIAACNKPTPHFVKHHGARILAVIAEVKSKASSLTSPFLASTLPPLAGSPALRGEAGEPGSALELVGPAVQTPNKLGKNMFGATAAHASGLPPVSMTPATAASALFSQLSTSTPHHHQHQHSHEAGMHASAQSPVMTVDQLYSAANWTQAGQALERGLAAQRQGQQPHEQRVLQFDLIGAEPHGSPQQRSRGLSAGSGLQALLSPAPKHSTFSMLSRSAEPFQDLQSNQHALAEVRSSLLAAAPIQPTSAPLPPHHPRAHSHSTPAKSTTPLSSAMDDDESAQLRTPQTGEPQYSFTSPSPMSLTVIPSPATVPASTSTAPAAFTSIAADVAPSASSLGGAAADDAPLPSSMREIYKISNENRRNKKKKLTHSSHPGINPAQGDADEDEGMGSAGGGGGGAGASKGGKKKGGQQGDAASSAATASDANNSAQFMQSIGWGTGAPPPSAAAQQMSHQPNSANASVDS